MVAKGTAIEKDKFQIEFDKLYLKIVKDWLDNGAAQAFKAQIQDSYLDRDGYGRGASIIVDYFNESTSACNLWDTLDTAMAQFIDDHVSYEILFK